MTRSTAPAPPVRPEQSYRLCSAEQSTDGPNVSRTDGRKAAETQAFEVFGKTERQPNRFHSVRLVPNTRTARERTNE